MHIEIDQRIFYIQITLNELRKKESKTDRKKERKKERKNERKKEENE